MSNGGEPHADLQQHLALNKSAVCMALVKSEAVAAWASG